MDEVSKFDFEAEKFVIASVLMDKDALLEAIDILKPGDFLEPKNKEIYLTIYSLFEQDLPVDYLTVLSDLRRRKSLAKVGSQYLADLSILLPTAQNVRHYAEIVKECSVRRQLGDLSVLLGNDSKDPSLPPQDLLERAEKLIFDLAQKNSNNDYRSIKELFAEAYDRVENLSKNPDLLRGIPTGFDSLDQKLGGFHKSDFVVIGARPGVGKTSLMLNITAYMAKLGKKVGFFSLEMSKEQIVDRIISMEGSIDLWKIRMGHIKENDKEWQTMSDVFGLFEKGDILIDDTAGLTMTDIRTRARKMKLEQGLDIIFIDYLQLVVGGKGFQSNRVQEVAEISRSIKILARELNIPIITGSQLSRLVESRDSKKPQLSDLRESGSIEQDADVVIFLHREAMYESDPIKKLEVEDKADIIVSKHRNGATGEILLKWIGQFASFAEFNQTEDQG